MPKGRSGTSHYSGPHRSSSCGGKTHVDIKSYGSGGKVVNKSHSTGKSDISYGKKSAKFTKSQRRSGGSGK